MKKSFVIMLTVFTVCLCFSAVSCGKKKDEKVYNPVSFDNLTENESETTAVIDTKESEFKSLFVRTVEKEIKERPDESCYSTSFENEETFVGYFIKASDGKTFNMYSWPSKKSASVVGTFSSENTGVVLYSYFLDTPVPISEQYFLIRNLDTGIEGWVYYDMEYDDLFKFTTTDNRNEKSSAPLELVNATVTKSTENKNWKTDNFEINSNGEICALLSGNNIEVYNRSEAEPFVVIDGTKFTPSLTRHTIVKFSPDSKNLYILQEEGNLYRFNFEEGATQKLWTFNFEDQNGDFKGPQCFSVSSDNRFFYVTAYLSTYSRTVPRILVYDSKKEKQSYFDIRGRKDSQNGYYYYSDFKNTPDGQTFVKMSEGETLAVRFFVNGDDEISYDKTEFNDSRISDIIPYPDSKCYIIVKEWPGCFEKVSYEGILDESSRKYIFDPFPDKSYTDMNVIINYDNGLVAININDRNAQDSCIYIYSLKTLNLLYSFMLPYRFAYNDGIIKWIDNKMFMTTGSDSEFTIETIDIKEKEKQMSLVYDWNEVIDWVCSKVSNFASDNYLSLYVNFTSQGFYSMCSRDDRDFDSTVLAHIDGKYDFTNDLEVKLYEAGNGVGPALEEGDEALERLHKRLMYIPLLEDKGTLTMQVREAKKESWEKGDEKKYEVYCNYYEK